MAKERRTTPEQKMLAEWFWTDRWMGSSAFLLPIEPRGLYREMLTQAWRREAKLPNDPETIRRAVGVTEAEWERCWPKVKGYWRVDGDYLVNDTQVAVYLESLGRAKRLSKRGKLGAKARAQALLKQHASATSEGAQGPPSGTVSGSGS
jgi:uncharacterized protein YdaU (DUF1376 family)